MTDSDRVVVITGATGGLGTCLTKAFETTGVRVVRIARSAPAEIEAELSTSEEAKSAVQRAHAVHGRIDALIHLVGGFAGGASIAETTPATFDAMFNLNVRTAFNVISAVVPLMRQAGSGRIVTVGSRSAVEPSPCAGVYAASKAALVSLTRTLAAENSGHGITATMILPGTMDTLANRAAMPAADPSKWVRPSDIAELIVYLARPCAAAVNGAVIPVYGGQAS